LALPELLPNDDLIAGVDPVKLEHVLGDVQTDRGNLHPDGSPHVNRQRRSPYGTSTLGAGKRTLDWQRRYLLEGAW
jgi:hypothetical protein